MDIRLPTVSSMAGQVLGRLFAGERLSHRSFDKEAATYRLSAPIHTLRHQCGVPIDDLWLECVTRDRTGRRAKFKEYFINPGILAEIKRTMGDRLQAFVAEMRRFQSGAAATAPAQDGAL